MNENPTVPLNVRVGDEKWLRALAKVVNRLLEGRTNNCGEFTVTPSVLTTTVEEPLCTPSSVINPVPVTAGAALDLSSGMFYIVAGDGSFQVFHDDDPATSRKFRYTIAG